MKVLMAAVLVAGFGAPALAGEPAPRRNIRLSTRTDDRPFSDAVLAGDTLYLAGALGLDRTTNKPPPDPAQEAKNALDRIKAVLGEAGMTMDELVLVQVHCSDAALYDVFNTTYAAYFKHGFPARAFITSPPLLFGARFEIQGIAVRR